MTTDKSREVRDGRVHLVGHFQVADHPGRAKPGSIGLDRAPRMQELHDVGCSGSAGLVNMPSGPTLETLTRARDALGFF